ncbi:MAG: hypothetical protein K0V04_26375 [Deltaproteobacteria bacterium]|nr:hypothetical protein [Deltaproteobacteria bacterium]
MTTAPFRSVLLGAVPLLVALSSNTAEAISQVHPQVAASTIHYQWVTVPAFSEYSWETTELSPGADTVMHLWDWGTGTEQAYNDDYQGLRSRVSFSNDTGFDRQLLLVVRSYSTASQGTARLLVNGYTLASQIPVGGTHIDVENDPGYQHETAQAPGGATSPYLLALSPSRHLVDIDFTSGVGYQARVEHSSTWRVVVGTTFGSGPVNLYSNDVEADNDGDGLGIGLEYDLGTCDVAAWAHCSDVHNLQDTDRDGLSDSAEVFGIDDGWYPQHLAAWGADPRHKDVFVELDWSADFPGQPFTAADAEAAQAIFDEGAAADLVNPDGIDGVRLHLDTGVAPSNPSLATLVGDWGGAGSVPAGTSYKTAPTQYRALVRSGVFRYGLLNPGNGGGQAKGSPTDRFNWGVTMSNRYVVTFAHELGHALGVDHWGHDQWGKANGKANYQSLMSYTYSQPHFSQGSSEVILDPSFVHEQAGIGADATLLSQSPYDREIGMNDEVDWDFDGTFAGGGFVSTRGPVTYATGASTNALDKNRQDLHTDTDLAATTPSLVRGPGGRLYAFYVDDGRIFYRHGLMNGDRWKGSCPGGDELGDACTTWSSAIEVPTETDARGVTALGGEEQVLLAFRTEYDSLRTIVTNGATGGGTLTDWGAETYQGVYTDKEPEVDWMRVEPESFDGYDKLIGLFYREKQSGEYRWMTMTHPGAESATSQGPMRDLSGGLLHGTQSPTFTAWPYDPMTTDAGTICGAITDVEGKVGFYCYDRLANRFADLSWSAFPTATKPISAGKPGLAFRSYRSWIGLPQSGHVERGAMWLSVVVAHPKWDYVNVWISDPVSDAGGESLSEIYFPAERRGKFGSVWTNAVDGSGLALYDDAELGSMKALWLSDEINDEDADPEEDSDMVRFQPFADGTFRAQLTDGNDFQVMERGICRGLASSSYCGPSSFGLD